MPHTREARWPRGDDRRGNSKKLNTMSVLTCGVLPFRGALPIVSKIIVGRSRRNISFEKQTRDYSNQIRLDVSLWGRPSKGEHTKTLCKP